MKIKEKRYIKKCDCGTEIIYTRRDCYHNTTWDIYSLYCPSCSHEYSYRRGTHHDLFDKEYEEDSVDKDEEIERLNNIIKNQQEDIEEYNDKLNEVVKERNKYLHIINELEKYINKTKLEEFEKEYGRRYGKTFTQAEVIICNMILNKLQELKGSDKE